MKELDLLLTRYLEQEYHRATLAEQQTFQTLLELPDIDLYAYLIGQETSGDDKLLRLIETIRNI